MKSSKLRFHTNKGLLVDTHAYARGRSAPCRPHVEQEEKVWFTKFDKKMCLGRVCMSLKADLNCMVKFVGQNCWQNFCIETTAMTITACFIVSDFTWANELKSRLCPSIFAFLCSIFSCFVAAVCHIVLVPGPVFCTHSSISSRSSVAVNQHFL